jgi:ribosomal protein S18 acetylase RimI-like enzyme
MTMEPTIRRATAQDVPRLAVLFDLYRQFYHKPSDLAGAERFLAERLENGQSVVFVAESEGGNLSGFTQLYPTFSSLGMCRSWVLNDLFVVESARRLGIGRRLIQAAHQLATSTGARSITLETQIENHKAQALYESLGYEAETEFRVYSKTVA